MYELAGKLSRAFSSSALAACIMSAEVLGRVVNFGEPGFKGSGGGARSGSELSHLKRVVSPIVHEVFRPARELEGGLHGDRRERM